MYLLSRAPMIDVNPVDGKEYEYSLEFVRPMNDENTHYLYNFKRSLYPIDQSTISKHNETRSLLIEISEVIDSDLDKLCKYPGKYWYYYSNEYNHYTPKKIYCKFNREGVLVYNVQCTPRVLEEFNKVLNMYDVTEGPKYGFPTPGLSDNNKIGYGPIFEINVWVPRGKTIREALTEDIRLWISEYINTVTENNTEEGDDNDEQDNR